MTKPKTAVSPAEIKPDDGDGVLGHKLCGYLTTVFEVASPRKTLPINARLTVSPNGRGGVQCFCDGTELLPIYSTQASLSVARQLQTLLINRCLNFIARVIEVSARENKVRALVLVDVYLPLAVWSSAWQFPKSRSVATAFFKHLSCDWKTRQLLLSGSGQQTELWNIPGCHSVGCEHKCSFNTDGELFQLHEIFKTLPSLTKNARNLETYVMCISPDETGIWLISDDIVLQIISLLEPADLIRVSATCRHLRSLAATIIPSGKLKLFPHQQAAVEWMLERERVPGVVKNPSDAPFIAEDGSDFYINMVSGKIGFGSVPEIKDFRGGMFCDEPGLGKTITALSLILKTKGALPDPPHGVQVLGCDHSSVETCSYYDEVWTQSLGVDIGMSASKESGSANEVASEKAKTKTLVVKKKRASDSWDGPDSGESSYKRKRPRMVYEDHSETWVQCDGCEKWRKLVDGSIADTSRAWFCSMNDDPLHQNCKVSEETGKCEAITHLPGFCDRESEDGLEENVSYFISVLKKHRKVLEHSQTEKVLKWLLKLPPQKLSEMETIGLGDFPVSLSRTSDTDDLHHGLFRAFGLVKKVVKGATRWFYPKRITNLVFDFTALRMARKKSLDSSRFYLSWATLIVVPANLVDHWKNQIQKHVNPDQLRVYVWNDHRKPPSPHHLAWDYDVVITTFSRLSVEWGQRQKSALMQVHWLRVILDEGHTLGSSLHSTNKLQTAVFLRASRRWVLTGTPTPNTPSSQLSHLHPMLKFLHEKVYGLNQKAWKEEIVKPFEDVKEEGRSRLLQLLERCMISARKADLKGLPPCIRKVTLLDFTEEHAETYNQLVETVRRNILLADWNDPSHVESLLNPKQWKFRSNTIRNIRLSCCVSGNMRLSDAGADLQETIETLIKSGLDPLSQEFGMIWTNLSYGGLCTRCKMWCRLPILTPCLHFLCLDCASLDSTMCPVSACGRLYEMQNPDSRITRPENPNPKWPVPKDLIELQPSYKQDDWHSEWESTSSSKVSYLLERLTALQEDSKESMLPEKVIVFSQFLEHIRVIEQQLTIAGIQFSGMYNPTATSGKMASLARFQNDERCMVLVMDGSAALGLDLSFVSHVFLMEPIWDKSVEEQVISRAHRMGATRPVHVETLAMSGTIEEQMLNFLEMDGASCDRLVVKDESGKNSARVHRTLHDFADTNYLTQLRFVRTD